MLENVPIEYLEIGIGTGVGVLGLLAFIMYWILKGRDENYPPASNHDTHIHKDDDEEHW